MRLAVALVDVIEVKRLLLLGMRESRPPGQRIAVTLENIFLGGCVGTGFRFCLRGWFVSTLNQLVLLLTLRSLQ